MVFNSIEYGLFLVLVFAGFWLLAKRRMLRTIFLVVASYVFYAASNPWFLILIAGSTVTDYCAGRVMEWGEREGKPGHRKAALVVSLVINLGMLAVFKYSNFFYSSGVDIANTFGAELVFERLQIMLPAGISFYTFQTMSYSIDVYRGRLKPERRFIDFALFVGFFPQLVAGPIVRAVDFIPQIDTPPYLSRPHVARALWLIHVGLLKKVVFADFLAVNLVDRVFKMPETFTSSEVMLGLYGYTMQVYLDFSAYSDIAIGSALLLGFRLPDNFDRPYMATSIQDFWRRWHKTLGSWLRDYLYYPLGGSRGGQWRTTLNLTITFVLIGLWHGPDWTFVVYGLLHAAAMATHRWVRVNIADRKTPVLNAWGWTWRVFLTLHFVVLARILFRCKDFTEVGQFLNALGGGTFHVGHIAWPILAVLAGTFLFHWTPRAWVAAVRDRLEALPFIAQGAVYGLVLLAVVKMASAEVIPFVYFQF